MEHFGALVGWTHQDHGERILLRLETVSSRDEIEKNEPDIARIMLTKQQAGVLANYLFKLSGGAPARTAKQGFFRRVFG
ncbi:hypothetical protein [Erythrobacter sp. THAF29]|uniref:hypothetical protein n=1 Tax=Erythrobacter sp. THAF29 TaxID=2587851 RepID=UPI001267E308|nr:hypothetical protein [Erythrobacter sp. THAF29]QFT77464.1 hypothetical protein FIU90_07935 [Erythrobacter sp. THAF29]